MTDLGNYNLQPPTTTPSMNTKRWQIVAIIAVVLIGALVTYYVTRAPAPPPLTVETIDESDEAIDTETETEEEIQLPALSESDAFVRELVAMLSAHPTLAAWLATEELIRTFVVAVENMAQGDTPSRHLSLLAPRESFRISGDSTRLIIDPDGYARYDLLVDAFNSLDVVGCGELYRLLKPLLVEAYRDLGYPEGDFDAAMSRAIEYVMRTPIITREIPLLSRTVAYEFADETLAALAPVQQQALRMGPRNLRLVQRKLGELTTALGLQSTPAAGPEQ